MTLNLVVMSSVPTVGAKEVGLKVLRNLPDLPDKALEGELADEQFGGGAWSRARGRRR